MKKNLLLVALLGLSTSIFASTCKVDSNSLQWTAFKTPAKVGVKGTFDNIKLNYEASTSQIELLQSSNVTIVTSDVNSNNQGRDAKLVNNFFNVQGVKAIDAKVLKVHKETADVEISMNGVKKVISMTLTSTPQSMKLNGSIDLADFKMLPSLEAITKACYALHQGKTWQDVTLEFTINTSCK
ncbi:YceI family protein [Sulfurimonas microaerophilic]|uniref:YceI family protein n=1 Tax=Sulfurimonas microaerophilic TaxID=3058392 RepID=UPI0027152FD7|nr:YceI family protein [Sulfurimonas sp. hsl 1-7]